MKILGLFSSVLFIQVIVFVFSPGVSVKAQEMQNIAELSSKSDLIVVGKVSSINSGWNSARTRIYSKISIDVSDLIKGTEPGKEISIMQPGGEVGEVGEIYSDIPRFTRNENVLLFLKKMQDNSFRVTGGMDGKFPVTINTSSGEKLVGGQINLSSFISEIRKSEVQH